MKEVNQPAEQFFQSMKFFSATQQGTHSIKYLSRKLIDSSITTQKMLNVNAMISPKQRQQNSKAPSTPATCRSNMSNVASTWRMLPFDMSKGDFFVLLTCRNKLNMFNFFRHVERTSNKLLLKLVWTTCCRFGNMSNDLTGWRVEDLLEVIIAHAAKVLVGFAVTHWEVLQQYLISTKTRTTANPRPHPTQPHLAPLFTFLCYCSDDNSRQTQLKFVVCIHVLTDVTSRVINTHDVYHV